MHVVSGTYRHHHTHAHQDTPVLSKYLGDLVLFTLQVASNLDLGAPLRVMALNFLLFCVDVKRTRLQKLSLVPQIIDAMFRIGAEEDEDEDSGDSGDGSEEESPSKVAFQVLNCVGMSLPPAQVFPAIRHLITTGYAASARYGERKACMLAVAVVVDGCADYMRPQMGEFVVPMLVAGLTDPHAAVRRSACIAVSSLADELAEDVIKLMHPAVLPPLFNLLDGEAAGLAQATSALDSLVEGMTADDIVLYLPVLMDKLAGLLTRSVGAEDADLKGTVLGAIGSAAHASKAVCIAGGYKLTCACMCRNSCRISKGVSGHSSRTSTWSRKRISFYAGSRQTRCLQWQRPLAAKCFARTLWS